MPHITAPTPQAVVRIALPLAVCSLVARLAARYADGSILPFLIALAWFLGVAVQLAAQRRWPRRGAAERYFVLPFLVTATALVLTGATAPTDSSFWSAGQTPVAFVFREVRDFALPVAFWACLLGAGFAGLVPAVTNPVSTLPVVSPAAPRAPARYRRPGRPRKDPDIPF